MSARTVSLDQVIEHLDEVFRSRAFVDPDKSQAMWRLARAELRRRARPSTAMRAVTDELQRGRGEAGLGEDR